MAGKARLVTLMPVANMNRAIRFYTKSLGARLSYRGRGAMRERWASLRFGSDEVWLIRPETRERRKLAYSTLLVPDIKRTVGRLVRNGVRFQRAEAGSPKSRIEGPISFEPFGASAFFKDSEGNLLMVWQNFPPM